MIRRSIEIVTSSFKMALQELWKNKLRTFLSLFGITIGIFCIIGVLTTVGSLERNLQDQLKSLGTNTIYVDKWDYSAGGGPDFPWWRYVNRPVPKYQEMKQITERTAGALYVAFRIKVTDNVEYNGNTLSNINLYGISEDFENIQPVEVQYGRYLSDAEFDRGSNAVVIGIEVAEKLFGTADVAVGKEIVSRGKKIRVIGIIKKQGKQIIGGWNFDQSIVIPYKFARNLMNELKADPLIIVQGTETTTSKALKDELTGVMRAIHKLTPTKEEDFALNDINDFSAAISSAFVSLNIGGWAIAGLSLIVGMFGVANIMFVSVRERTNLIGIQKSLGAKNYFILAQFLFEAVFLSLMGGIIGLLLIYLLTFAADGVIDMEITLTRSNIILGLTISVLIGIISGFIPAYGASQLDPVEAIRTN